MAVVRWVARESGYAIGVHGTLIRDIDLMAMAWGDGPCAPEELAKRIADELDWNLSDKVSDKPRGRKAFTMRPKRVADHHRYIDLSVMDAMGSAEKLILENIDLKDKVATLEAEIAKAKEPPTESPPATG